MSGPTALPARLHHHAFVCRDQEQTRHFYEDVIGLPLIATWAERDAERAYCHTFFGLADGSALAFFQFADPDDYERFRSGASSPFAHIALSVTAAVQGEILDRLKGDGRDALTVDHGYCVSLYADDPDGLLLEFTVDHADVATINDIRRRDAHADLARWRSGDHASNNAWRRS